jgi:hypothetical protein
MQVKFSEAVVQGLAGYSGVLHKGGCAHPSLAE